MPVPGPYLDNILFVVSCDNDDGEYLLKRRPVVCRTTATSITASTVSTNSSVIE